MIKIVGWLLLTLVSSGGLVAYFLQQQYEEKSAEFLILYRDVTIKLSQHDAIIPLLPANRPEWEVQKLFPQIIRWRQHSGIEPRRSIVAEKQGRYWLNIDNQSLLIDLNRLISDVVKKNRSNIWRYNGITRRSLSKVPQVQMIIGVGKRDQQPVAAVYADCRRSAQLGRNALVADTHSGPVLGAGVVPD
ncbi:MAG: hypothetical protein L0G81_05105 [Ewingella sp.]|nr:hypothetical protein [Ewingella sp.]